jgi:Fur family ferric uptake transcriptional regulator
MDTPADSSRDTHTDHLSDLESVRVLLCDMKAGQEGTIVRISGESTLRRRLLEMGINRGTRVYVEKYAPLKDPIELVVKGYHVSLRVEEAAHILIEKVTTRKHNA